MKKLDEARVAVTGRWDALWGCAMTFLTRRKLNSTQITSA